MTNKEKIRYLKRFKKSDLEINQLLEEKAMWESRAAKMTTPVTGMPLGGSGENPLEHAVEKICEVDQEINAAIDGLQDIRREVLSAVETVQDDTLKALLKYRYISGKTFEEIAVSMNYSWRQVHRLHSKALSKIKMA